MGFASVAGIALVIGILIVLGIAIVSYVSSLARSAYELKVELRKDLDDGLKRVEAEMVKQTKWARGDILAEVERSRGTMLEDLSRRAEDLQAALNASLLGFGNDWQDERKAILDDAADLAERIAILEHRLRARTRPVEEPPQETAEKEPPEEEAAATPLALPNFELPAALAGQQKAR